MSFKRRASTSPEQFVTGSTKKVRETRQSDDNGNGVVATGSIKPDKASMEIDYSSGEDRVDQAVVDTSMAGSDEDSDFYDQKPVQAHRPGFESVEWQRTIERVVKSVVAIQFAAVASFDTDPALVSEATGFIVDSTRGIIMTNRHVVGPGPFTGFAVFDNHEECDVKPIYRDPVHDFGFLQFDPAKIKYMQVQELQLQPHLAKVGSEIRVIGNDAGEKLSILAGFISRLDRNAPDYGDLTYSDFNTEYIQAAASASGGSSGSPVVNIDGHVVALQAGGNNDASTDFFLPLFRGKRALECIQNASPVTRGTIQVQWLLKPYDECRRLGLTAEAERSAREHFPDVIGLLVAETVLPEGPSDGLVQEGDCLLSINGEPISKFVRVDEILDSSVGSRVTVVVERGGERVESTISVGDLHAITPDRYVEVCGALFQNLSYQLARLYAIPTKGVHICDAAGSFRLDGSETKGWILDELDDRPTPDLDAFIEVMRTIPDGARVSLKYRHIRDLHSINYSIAYIDRHWRRGFKLAVRNDKTGLWDFTDLGKTPPPQKIEPQTANFVEVENIEGTDCGKLVKSFVKVASLLPLRIEGFPRTLKAGYGLVIDAEKGLVVVSRNIVPYDLCDISITIAESVVVPGKVRFLHPLQNYAVVSYDPSLVLAPLESPKLSDKPLRQGNSVVFMGHNHNLRMVSTKTRVTDVSTVTVPPNSEAPRYRAINLDAIAVDTTISAQCGSGVLADNDGSIRALWLSCLGERSSDGRDHEYRLGLDITSISAVLNQLRAGETPKPRFLDFEVNAIQVVQARIRGVGEEWIKRVEQNDSERHQLFNIMRVATGPNQVLQEGDIILAINGRVITRVSELDIADEQELKVTIVRNKEELTLTVPTVSGDDLGTDRVVSWCGAILHKPHHAVRQQIKKVHSGVYVAGRSHGSPAYQYAIAPTNFITHINGKPTETLDDFLAAVKDIPDNTYVRLRVVTFDNVPFACSIKTNYHYFPTGILEKVEKEWNARELNGTPTGDEANGHND